MGRRPGRFHIWDIAAGTTLASGLASGVAIWGFWGPASIAVALFVFVFLAAAPTGRSAHAAALSAFRWAIVSVSISGLLAAFGWLGVALLATVAATSPQTRYGIRSGRLATVLRKELGYPSRRRVAPTTPGDAPDHAPTGWVALADMPDTDGTPALDDKALCDAWRRSYVRLEGSPAAEMRLEVVRLRQVYLDELVRRHPAEVRRWFASGARAAGNPLPYLTRRARPDGPPGRGT